MNRLEFNRLKIGDYIRQGIFVAKVSKIHNEYNWYECRVYCKPINDDDFLPYVFHPDSVNPFNSKLIVML
jgi:hypothetical protein